MHNIFRNGLRKGWADFPLLFLFIKMAFLFAVAIAVVVVVHSFISEDIDVFDAESDIFLHAVLYSQDGISYVDPVTKRVYPYMIDPRYFLNSSTSSERLQKAFSSKKPFIAAKFSLEQKDSRKSFVYKGKELQPLYYNEEAYKKWIVIAKSGATGIGGVQEKTRFYNVILNDGENVFPADLAVSVVIPNS
ncbi:MAG: hypothetical protein QXK37_02285 [Candidatus Woesearchaeota archaeon]